MDQRPRTAAQLADALDPLESRPGYDVAGALRAAEEIEREALLLADARLQMRARLVRGDLLDRMGDVAGGAQLVLEVNRWATERGDLAVLARTHRLLSTTFHNLGDPAGCLEHAVRAMELLDDDTPPEWRALHLMTLADALAWAGSFDAARDRYREAEEIHIATGDAFRQTRVLNNLAYTEYEAGEPERAWEAVQRMREVASAHGLNIDHAAVDTTARALIGIGRYAEAERSLREYIDSQEMSPYVQADNVVEHLLTLAEAQRLQGRVEQAQASLDRCTRLCEERELADVRVRVLAEQAEVYAAVGDFEHAYAVHKAFHDGHEALRSIEREAQARARQSLFETAEARAQAERFREQALRDPLTRLYNRRYVDEKLPAMLAERAGTGAPLTAAVLDLDHFKRINDTLSHDVGDRVLVIAAGLIGRAAGTGGTGQGREAGDGFAARLGGEEFLVVLTGVGPGDAVERMGKLRRAVAGYPWRDVTGDLPVTVSIGVTMADAETTQNSLLARADDCLYTAKQDGRDRVHVDPAVRLERRRHRSR